MLTRIRSRLTAKRVSAFASLVIFASCLFGISVLQPQLVRAGDSRWTRYSAVDPDEETEEPEEEDEESEKAARRKPKVRPVQFTEPEEEEDDSERLDYSNGNGMFGRISHLAGKTFGRNDSITPLEVVPYMLADEHFIFSDIRGFVTNRSQVGGNLGVGYRRLFDDRNAWAGASFWYDADQSTSKLFQQVGLSFEGLINQFEVRSNIYLPFSTSQTFSNGIGSSTIVGNQLMYTRSSSVGTALRGVDFEVGYSMPVQDKHVVRGFVGGYHFEGGSTSGVNGVRVRVEGVINNTISAQAMYTHDNLYGSNLMVGVSLQFPFADNHPTYSWTRNTPSPFRYVERNYNVIVAESQVNSGQQVATDPTTNTPYLVEQVNSSASGGTPNGTAANPYSTVAAAQAAGGNVFLVQSGSVLNESITLSSGQHLFGQGNFLETLPTTGGGNVPIPSLVSGATPIIQNSTGSAITLASNTEVAGFNITGATGNGITGTGVSGVSLHDLVFGTNGGSAINLSGVSGNVSIYNTQVNSTSTSPAISLVNSSGTTTLSNLNINTQNGTGLYASNVSNLEINGGTFTATNAPAIDIETSTVNANVTSVSANGGAEGIKLITSTGNFTISGTGSAGSGGTIQNTTTAGILISGFGNSNLNWINFTNNAVGIQSLGSGQLVVNHAQFTGSTGYAIDSLNDSMLLVNNSTFSSNGSGGGSGTIRVQSNTTGTFTQYIENSTITDNNGTAIQFLTQSGGAGATLMAQITGNTINGYNNGSSIVSANWTGPATFNISNNNLNAYGANMTAVYLQDPSLSGALTATIDSNTITFENTSSTSGTGIWVVDGQSGQTSTVASNVTMYSNAIVFQGASGTGMRFAEYETTVDTLTSNVISDKVGSGTGMLFDYVASNSALVINSNTVNLLTADPTTHRGLVFTQLGSNVTFTTLTGAISNAIDNASAGQSLVIPNGQGVGGILINGHLTLLPQ